MNLAELKQKMAKDLFGITVQEAMSKGICIHCKNPALERCYSAAGRREYSITGMCELCFDEITTELEDDQSPGEEPAF